jgi:hypothetical protein
METTKAKYKIGTKVQYKLDNPNIPLQYGIIQYSYYSNYSDKVYYTILKDDGTATSEVPEDLIEVIDLDFGDED